MYDQVRKPDGLAGRSRDIEHLGVLTLSRSLRAECEDVFPEVGHGKDRIGALHAQVSAADSALGRCGDKP